MALKDDKKGGGPSIGKILGTALIGPLGMQLVKHGGLPGMLYDSFTDKKKRKPGEAPEAGEGMKRGGKVKKYAKGGSASSRGDGIAKKGKTKGRFV